MELALATNTSPSAWWDESDETLATALAVLDRQADEIRKARRGRHR